MTQARLKALPVLDERPASKRQPKVLWRSPFKQRFDQAQRLGRITSRELFYGKRPPCKVPKSPDADGVGTELAHLEAVAVPE